MKKVWQSFAVVCVLFVLSIFLLSCKNVKPELVLTQTQYQLEIGETADIDYSIKNGKDDMIVLFSSENDEVATVDEAGKITAHEEGEAVITALIEGYP